MLLGQSDNDHGKQHGRAKAGTESLPFLPAQLFQHLLLLHLCPQPQPVCLSQQNHSLRGPQDQQDWATGQHGKTHLPILYAVVVVDRFYSAILHSPADSLRSHVILHE